MKQQCIGKRMLSVFIRMRFIRTSPFGELRPKSMKMAGSFSWPSFPIILAALHSPFLKGKTYISKDME